MSDTMLDAGCVLILWLGVRGRSCSKFLASTLDRNAPFNCQRRTDRQLSVPLLKACSTVGQGSSFGLSVLP